MDRNGIQLANRVDDPYSSYYAGYDPVQSYMDSYFTQQAQAQNAQPPAPTGGAGGVANTVAGLAGTGAGYYTVNNLIPGIGSAATAAPATPQLVSATLSGLAGLQPCCCFCTSGYSNTTNW